MKRLLGYARAVRQYLATEKGAYDFYDAVRALLVIFLSMAAALALAVFLFG
jgi:hypothetical protein